jgi:hypothetical protein
MANLQSGNRAFLFHTAEVAKLLTPSFVAGTEFRTNDETEMTLDIVLSGTAMTSCNLQLEINFSGTDWNVVPELPLLGVLDGGELNHTYTVVLQPRANYRWSAKSIGGDATSAALIRGSTRLLQGQGIRLANTDPIPPAYDSDDDADRVTVVNPWNKTFDGGALVDVSNQSDGTYDYYIDLDGVRACSFQLVITTAGTVTITFEGTTWDDGTVAASCTYVDLTNKIYGAASFTATGMMFDSGKLAGQLRFGHLKVVKAGGGVGAWRIDARGID